jgi:glutamate-ammonia-ligase adenylyltransferase
MRQLMEDERPGKGDWDLKLTPGGLVDIEFAAQFLQLVHAAAAAPWRRTPARPWRPWAAPAWAIAAALAALEAAWRLEQDLSQLLKVALEDGHDPDTEPKAFRALLARAGRRAGVPVAEDQAGQGEGRGAGGVRGGGEG